MSKLQCIFLGLTAFVLFILGVLEKNYQYLEKIKRGESLSDEEKVKLFLAILVAMIPVISLVASLVIPILAPKEHIHETFSTQKEMIVEASCLGDGKYDSVSYCECGEELGREVLLIPALGHNYIEEVTSPSCNENGYTIVTCSRCKDSYIKDYTEALGHDYVENVIQPTCSEKGYTTYRCSRCNESYVENYTEELGHNFVNEICTHCGIISPNYEKMITDHVNKLVDDEKYGEAINIVNDALKLTESDTLTQLLVNIQTKQESAGIHTISNVDFVTYSGSINRNDQEDIYSLTVSIDGYYRFDLSNMVNGFSVKLKIFNSSGDLIKERNGLTNSEGVTCELEQGNIYTIKVIQYANIGDYILTIGQPKETVNISANDVIYDSIEYTGQKNEYIFEPSLNGVYRFDLSDVISGVSFKCQVFDSLNFSKKERNGIGNGDGFDVNLDAGEVYTIRISQYSNVGYYTLSIGKQQPTRDISGQNNVDGSITYTNQDNIYTFTPPSSGKYIFNFMNMVSGFSVKFKVYDALGYNIKERNGVVNEDSIPIDLDVGETYTIHIIQYYNIGSYDISISNQ